MCLGRPGISAQRQAPQVGPSGPWLLLALLAPGSSLSYPGSSWLLMALILAILAPGSPGSWAPSWLFPGFSLAPPGLLVPPHGSSLSPLGSSWLFPGSS